MTPTRTSKAEMRRRVKALNRTQEQLPELADHLHAYLHGGYKPVGATDAEWSAVLRPRVTQIMRTAALPGRRSARLRAQDVARYLLARHRQGQSLEIADAMTPEAVDEYCRLLTNRSPKTLNDLRSRLRNLAIAVNPALQQPPRAAVFAHHPVKPPYTVREEATIKRIARTQRRDARHRQLCGVVGLAGGCGCDSADLRHITPAHIHDHGPDTGIEVDIPGPRPRRVNRPGCSGGSDLTRRLSCACTQEVRPGDP